MSNDSNGLSEKNHLSETPFPYEELLAYYREELRDPDRCAEIRKLVETDPHWKAHFESVRFLDLERAAAIQDGKDLQKLFEQWKLREQEPESFCKEVASTDGKVYKPLIQGGDRARESAKTKERWAEHVDQCVYCRRMRRQAHAKFQREQCDPPIEEPLLRDWLLEDHYVPVLKKATDYAIGVDDPTKVPVRPIRHVESPSRRPRFLFVLAVSLLVMCMGAGWTYSFTQLHDLREFLSLDSFWQLVGEDEDHPSTDQLRARPVVIVGQDVWVKGKVKLALIQELRVTVEPGLKEGEAIWQTKVDVDPGDAHAGVVPFDIRFTVPNDRLTRKVTIRLIPSPEALAAAPESLREGRLTYHVNVACLVAGPIAYVPDKPERPVLRGPTQVDKDSAVYEVEVEERLWGTKDVWVAVIPNADPSRVYLQGSKITSVESKRLAYLVLDDGKIEGEFQVVVLSCPKGRFSAEGLVYAREIERFSEILTSIKVLRTN